MRAHSVCTCFPAKKCVTNRARGFPSALALCAFLFFVPTRSAFGLDPTKSIFQYNCQTWTRREGLPANGINAIAQTRDGYLWLGTSKGLVRYDGIEFKVVGVSDHVQFRSQVISSLSISREGGLWFGINSGSFGYFDGQNFSPIKNVDWVDRNMDVRSIREAGDGSVWVAAQTAAGRLDKDKTRGVSFGNQLADAMTVSGGSLGREWVGTVRRGLFYCQDGRVIPFPDDSLKNNIVFAVAEDPDGQIWVGTEAGLRCYDRDFHRKEMGDLFHEVRSLLVDRHGVVWIGTGGNGLISYKEGVFSSFRKSAGLVDDYVSALCEDREGSLWIGTPSGLCQLTDVKFPIFSSTEGLAGGSCHAVCASRKGGFWAAMNTGISYFDGKQARNYTVNTGLPSPYIKRVFEARNGDIYYIDGDMAVGVIAGEKLVACYTNSTMPVAMAEDDQGVIVSVVGDLFRLKPNGLVPYSFKNGKAPVFSWIYNLVTSRDGSLWVASVNGIFRIRDGTYRQWSTPEGLSWVKVHWICEDSDGTIWAALPTGIARLKQDRVRNISRTDGLFDDFVFAIVPDDSGWLWVDSVRGIFRVSRRSLNDFADGKTDHVQCEGFDGLEAIKTIDKTDQEWSGCKTLDGRIWFPSPQGVVKINPANLRVNPVAPPVFITRVRADGIDLKDKGIAALRPAKNELEFQYLALSYVAPQRIQFRYFLEGCDRDWIDSGNRRSAIYSNLKPGKYTFRVTAANADGAWNASGDSFAIELLPHFYQTSWFYLGCATLAGAGLLGIYVWRVRHLRRKQREIQKAHDLLETKVEERTAQLEAQRMRLQTEIDERKRVQQEIERIHRQLVDASRQAGQAEVASSVLHNVGNVLNSVNTSANVITDQVRESKVSEVSELAELLARHQSDLPEFLARKGRGDQMADYLKTLSRCLASEQASLLGELEELGQNINHIKEIVAMQQSYACVSGVLEKHSVCMLVEDALRMHASGLARHHVRIQREFHPIPEALVDKHKILQILVNLISNAECALFAADADERVLTVGVGLDPNNRVRVSVRDNGVGIPRENLTRIFSHGFTTRENGHGFGLHYAALAAREMGGNLVAHSDGPGRGATFHLTIPVEREEINS